MEQDPSVLFPLLIPLRFKWSDRNSIIWKNEDTEFKIIPFASKGREKMGYRIEFKGSPESCQYLMDQFLSRFNPQISCIEWVHESDMPQKELVKLAEKSKYQRGSLYGIYDHDGIGVVLLHSNTVHLQVRDHSLTTRSLLRFMQSIEVTASVFLEKPIDLFSFAEEGEFV